MKKILFVLLIAIVGCSAQARLPGYLYLRLSSDPTTLDPAYIVDVSGGGVAAKLYGGLMRFDEEANILPDMASSFEISPDGRTYTFHLRPGIKFSNGRAVTARDFKYSFERVLSPVTKSPRTWLFDRIAGSDEFMAGKASEVSGIKTPDDLTVLIELRKPFGPFLGLLAMPGGYVVPREEVERWGDGFSDHPSGTGPYTLEKWEHAVRILLKANPAYYDDRPKLAGICYRVIPEDLTCVAEFERGYLDAISVPAPEFARYTKDPKWKDKVLSRTGMNIYYLGMNCSRPPFDNVLVRRAVSMAVDRRRILDTVYEKRGVLAYGPAPLPLLPLPPCCLDAYPYNYDPQEARKLLAQAGYKDGLSVKIYIGADQEVLDVVEVVQDYLAHAGIKADIVQLEWSAYKEAVNKGDADLFWLSWQADYPDPENFLYPVFFSGNFGSAGNRARFADAEFDDIILKAQSEPDISKRRALYRTAEHRVVEMAPWVFFWHKEDFVVRQAWVKGFRLYPINNADRGLGVELTKPLQ